MMDAVYRVRAASCSAVDEVKPTDSLVISKLIKCYKSRFDTEIKVNFGLKPVFITDERQFSAEPSLIFSQNFNFRYSLEKGFKEMVEELS